MLFLVLYLQQQWAVILKPINPRLFVKRPIKIAKRKFLNQPSTRTLLKHNPDFYKFILEASERGELWGLSTQNQDIIQLNFDFNTSKIT